MEKIIFFGNGMLADYTLETLKTRGCEVIFHARTKEDLEEAVRMKSEHPEAHGVLASYGVMIKEPVLAAFEPEGILNIHPSLLPLYRGASPIESAILAGDTTYGVSVMKLVRAMDAGPIYYQEKVDLLGMIKRLTDGADADGLGAALNLPSGSSQPRTSEAKAEVYRILAEKGAGWLAEHLSDLPEPTPQDDAAATFTRKFEKKDGIIDPEHETAREILQKIIAFAGFPKVKYGFYGLNCIILDAHIEKSVNGAAEAESGLKTPMVASQGHSDGGDKTHMVNLQGHSDGGDKARQLIIPCADGASIVIDRLQPEGRKPMDAKSFINGYGKKA